MPHVTHSPKSLLVSVHKKSLYVTCSTALMASKVTLSQAIMLRLQEKAHISLGDFRKGKSSASTSRTSPGTSLNSDDELDTLGGKTRLVANKESSQSPQMITSSPTSMTAGSSVSVSSSDDNQVHPSVAEYMRQFENHQSLPGPGSHTLPPSSYPDTSCGLNPISLPHHEQTPYHHLQPQPQQQYNGIATQAPYFPMTEATQLPQYFPVYDDYTPVPLQNGYHPMQTANGLPNASLPNMHTTWEDLWRDLV
jgi:peptidoglycan hydrolase-like protein with peptidoglycan-binding domain